MILHITVPIQTHMYFIDMSFVNVIYTYIRITAEIALAFMYVDIFCVSFWFYFFLLLLSQRCRCWRIFLQFFFVLCVLFVALHFSRFFRYVDSSDMFTFSFFSRNTKQKNKITKEWFWDVSHIGWVQSQIHTHSIYIYIN